jgi:hypothetical protein
VLLGVAVNVARVLRIGLVLRSYLKGNKMDHSNVRQEVIAEANAAIVTVRDIVRNLTVEERTYLHQTSPVYRQLVDTIRNWYAVSDGR